MFPLATYIHDCFHDKMLRNSFRQSLGQWVINHLVPNFNGSESVEVCLNKSLDEAVKKVESFLRKLAGFYEAYPGSSAALFYLLHEGGTVLIQPNDWNCEDPVQILEQWVGRMNRGEDQDRIVAELVNNWTTSQDPFETSPTTGALVKNRANDLLTLAWSKVPEVWKLMESEEEFKRQGVEFEWFQEMLSVLDLIRVFKRELDEMYLPREAADIDETLRRSVAFQESGSLAPETLSEYQRCFQEGYARLLQNISWVASNNWPIVDDEQQAANSIMLLEGLHKHYLTNKVRAQGITVTLEKVIDEKGYLRFIDALISRPTEFEPQRITLCTTLYHKRRNAWDLYNVLGGESGTGLPKPDRWETREDTMKNLHALYEEKLPQAFDTMLASARAYFALHTRSE